MNNIILSICVPSYNRSTEIERLADSIDVEEGVELVVCDDGSTDNTKEVLNKYVNRVPITYHYQKNSGRGFALKKAIEMSKGSYVIVMDSDDYFVPNTLSIICFILSTESYSSYAFGVKIYENKKHIDNIPPDVESNYISLKGDYKIKGDLKEVVKKDVIASCLYPEVLNCRRVPTFLIWCCVAEKVNCLSISIPVAVKEYLPGGMTDNGFLLRMECSVPMAELYLRLSHSTSYKSTMYRWIVRVLWARYAFHAKKIKLKSLWMKVVLLPGFFLYLIDRILLIKFFYKNNDI